MDFQSFNLHPRITESIKAKGFTTPTPIQEKSIPQALAQKDILGIAQTGTGKTAAFVLPILQRLMKGPRSKLRALIVAPTRELAIQINEVVQSLGGRTGLKSVLLFGGVGIHPQIKKLKSGVEIAVVCPGRFLDHIKRKTVNLSSIEILVLDEADQMFDMGFLPDIRKIVARLPKKRQTLLFSATMPDDIRKLANEILSKPETIEIGRIAPPQTIDHALYPVAYQQKTNFLLAMLKQIEVESVLVFTRTKHRAKRLAIKLEKSGYAATSLQGNLSQNRRQAAMQGFKKGKYTILVATDIAARGIDIASISHVINYDIPTTAETYTHRIGRTGRASRSGEAYTLVSGEDNKMVKAIEKLLGKRLVRRQLEDFSYEEEVLPTRKTRSGNNRLYKKKTNQRRKKPVYGKSTTPNKKKRKPKRR